MDGVGEEDCKSIDGLMERTVCVVGNDINRMIYSEGASFTSPLQVLGETWKGKI